MIRIYNVAGTNSINKRVTSVTSLVSRLWGRSTSTRMDDQFGSQLADQSGKLRNIGPIGIVIDTIDYPLRRLRYIRWIYIAISKYKIIGNGWVVWKNLPWHLRLKITRFPLEKRFKFWHKITEHPICEINREEVWSALVASTTEDLPCVCTFLQIYRTVCTRRNAD